MTYIQQALTLPISLGSKKLAREDLQAKVDQIQELLVNVKANEEVVLLDKNPVNFLLSFLILIDKKAVPISISSQTPDLQIKNLKQNYKTKYLINGELDQSHSKITQYENSYACFTSGSTGIPKLCYLSIENGLLNAKAHCESLAMDSDSTIIQSLPLYHSFGIVAYILAWLHLKCHLNLNLVFMGLKTLNKSTWQKATLHISPSQLRFMLKEKSHIPKGIETISVGGGYVDSTSLSEFQKKLNDSKLYVTYGLTEAGPRVSTGRWDGHSNGYMGKALSQVQIAVLNKDQIVLQGQGKLLIKSPTLKLNCEQTELIEDYLITRDYVRLEKDEVYFESREEDLINIGGISIYAVDIENMAKEHPEIINACALKKVSSQYEEEPVLFFEPKLDHDEITKFLEKRLSVQQMPKLILGMEKLPRTSLDKIDRTSLYKLMDTL